jgi:outer membrane receptor for ferrienterochelin and colicins
MPIVIFLFSLLISGAAMAAPGDHAELKGIVQMPNYPGARPFIRMLMPEKKLIRTDSTGAFHFKKIKPASQCILEFSMPAARNRRDTIMLHPGMNDIGIIQLEENPVIAGQIVVSGTMRTTYLSDSPVPIEVFSPTFFAKNPVPTIFEALQMVNGIRPQLNCGVCNTGDIHINGQEGACTMMLIDGMPIMSGLGTVYGFNGIPTSLIERVEIIRGPASALYGSEATGGIINIITRNPNGHNAINADISFTSDLEQNYQAGFSTGDTTFSIITGVDYYRMQNRLDRNKDGFTDLVLNNRFSGFSKILWKQNNFTSSLSLRGVYENRWGGQINWQEEFRGGDSIYGESIYTKRAEILSNQEYTVTNNIFRLQSCWIFHDQDAAYGINSFLARQNIAFAQFTWLHQYNETHNLLAGIAWRSTFYTDNSPAQKGNAGTMHVPGIFIQDEINADESNILVFGLRMDHQQNHGLILTPRINWKYNAGRDITIRAGMGRGFRIVNIFTEDHAALTGAREVVFQDKISPEQSWNINAGMQGNGNNDLIDFTWNYMLYATHYSNRIIPDYTTDAEKIFYRNLDGYAIVRGIAANTEFQLRSMPLSVRIGITLQDNYIVEHQVKRRQILAENFSGTFSISYQEQYTGIIIDYTGAVYGPMELPVFPNDNRPPFSPWFSIMNIQFSRKSENITFYVGLRNLLNIRPPNNAIMRAFDPFDRQVDDRINNPNGFTFDPSYAYTPFQGIRAFAGIRVIL